MLLPRRSLALFQLELELPDVVLTFVHLIVKHLELLGQGINLLAFPSVSNYLLFAVLDLLFKVKPDPTEVVELILQLQMPLVLESHFNLEFLHLTRRNNVLVPLLIELPLQVRALLDLRGELCGALILV